MQIVSDGKVDLMTLCDAAISEAEEAGCDVRVEVDPHDIKALLLKLQGSIEEVGRLKDRLGAWELQAKVEAEQRLIAESRLDKEIELRELQTRQYLDESERRRDVQAARDEALLRLDSFTWRVIDHDDEKSLPEEDMPVLLASQYPAGIFTAEAWLVDRERGLWHLEATDGYGDHQEVWGSDAKAWMPLPTFVAERAVCVHGNNANCPVCIPVVERPATETSERTS